ncbi:FHA domain-containing protein [Jonesia quinghaiensis]|uniref:FHA domain-containing protein n=1 Tax=Jonesia quinghaiensis TaxID=262806 RepID=UPI00041CE5CF|nr:FHA domain-containing protein [Jonesia quinghaiensis]
MFFYSPGDHIALVVDHFAVLLPKDTKATVVTTIWERCSSTSQRGLLGVLQAVTSALDQTLENLPDFVIVEQRQHGHTSDVRIAVSGEAIARIKVTNEPKIQEVSGRHIAMWLEQSYSAVEYLELGNHSGSQSLPLVSGVVRCSGLMWEAAEVTVSSPESHPLTVVSPPSAPLHTIDEDLGRTLIEIPEEWLSDHEVDDSRADYAMDQSLSVEEAQELAPVASQNHERANDDAVAPLMNNVSDSVAAPVGGLREVASGNVTSITVPPPALSTSPVGTRNRGTGYAPPIVGVGVVRFSHGEVVELGSPIVIGRKPTTEGSGAPMTARLMSVPSPSKDISRNHLMIRVEAGHVLVEDLDSVNGTVLRRRGESERTLPAREPVLVLNDDVVDLGDGVSLEFVGLR